MWVCLRATVSLLSCTGNPWLRWELGGRAAHVAEEPLKPGDDLLKRLFADRSLRPGRIEMGLVDAFGEQAGESPVRHRLSNLTHGTATLIPSEMNVGFGVAVELAGASATNVVGRTGKAR